MSKVILKGFIKVPAKELDNVKEMLVEHIKLTHNEKGCLIFNVIQRENDPLIFDVHEEFEDSVAFYSHQKRIKNSLWVKSTLNVERSYEVTGLEED